ncbi:uncharacterized protein LOC119792421 isoform X2 [Cyprinodon tularosa]|uniref:uncharacterized protein LOC119792421 isoform X2 n=1 Tax=Cyprinodon tularosa TaxID=77115 RepID=UPI0018E1E102|nr:uncharacterized protein LOC119792421 isoform X2 [Cyprinodon tularosa]
MISRILLLIIINSCLCATFVVNVTQSSYQAEENHNITLEWTFTTRPQGSWKYLFIYCDLITEKRISVLYQVNDGVEVSESQDEQFSGRVQSDKDVLREGRIRLHVSRLRTEDSGLYVCDVKTDGGVDSRRCRLNVSAGRKQAEPKRKPKTPTNGCKGRVGHYNGLIVIPAALLAFSWFLLKSCPLEKQQFEFNDNRQPRVPRKHHWKQLYQRYRIRGM